MTALLTVFQRHIPGTRIPVVIAALALLVGGIFFLERAEAQAHDTIRKHHLDDIEQSLYVAYRTQGTYPPYELTSWCGRLNDPTNAAVRQQVETALREHNTKYANPQKPFPTDPLVTGTADYFYWKRSPALFELYGVLEADSPMPRTTADCSTTPDDHYNYVLDSRVRQNPGQQPAQATTL